MEPPDPLHPDYDVRADVWSMGISLVSNLIFSLLEGDLSSQPCRSIHQSISPSLYDSETAQVFSDLGAWVYPKACVNLCVFKYLRDGSLVFSEIWHKVLDQ